MPPVMEPPDRLLDLIYDAATEPELWRTALTEIADRTGSLGAVLFGQSVAMNAVYFDYNGRLDETCNRAYKERHMQNVWSVAMEMRPVGGIVRSDEIISLSSLRKTPFYDEVLRPQGVAHNTMVPLAARNDFRVAFNICRSERQGAIDDDGRRFIERVVPHLCRSMQLGFRLDGYRALQRAEHDVLDRLSVGVVLLDRRARVIYSNAAAASLSSDDSVLCVRNGMIAARSDLHASRFASLIRSVLSGMTAASISLPRSGDGRPITVVASSVRGRDVGRFADHHMPDAAVLLLMIDPTTRPKIPSAWIMEAYGLTQAEARVALAASSGTTIAETAEQLGLSSNTVKTHLRKVFDKTGVSRQAELVRLVASIGLIRHDP
jgi:DNA-binding CsgD family transcriptional regulator